MPSIGQVCQCVCSGFQASILTYNCFNAICNSNSNDVSGGTVLINTDNSYIQGQKCTCADVTCLLPCSNLTSPPSDLSCITDVYAVAGYTASISSMQLPNMFQTTLPLIVSNSTRSTSTRISVESSQITSTSIQAIPSSTISPISTITNVVVVPISTMSILSSANAVLPASLNMAISSNVLSTTIYTTTSSSLIQVSATSSLVSLQQTMLPTSIAQSSNEVIVVTSVIARSTNFNMISSIQSMVPTTSTSILASMQTNSIYTSPSYNTITNTAISTIMTGQAMCIKMNIINTWIIVLSMLLLIDFSL